MEEFERLKTNVRAERREGSPFGKREEEATESFELEKRLALEKGIKDRLAEVEHALHKFENGTYGLCDACGQPIDPARLEALPQASLCLSCKTHLEEKSRSFPQRERVARYARYDEKIHILNFNVPDKLADWIEDMEMSEVRES
ncbi:RNA polymerase-binding transcription factor DksA [subsurface metagenome]